jgi:hypothetical protein
MAGESTIDLVLKVTDDGSITIDKFNQKIKSVETNAQGAAGGVGNMGLKITDFINPTTVAIAALTGMAAAAKEFIEVAAEAEQIESRMAFQIEQVGYSYRDAQPYVDQFANSILQTTRFSDEAARKGLGLMMQYTNDLGKATNGVQLAMDISTQTGRGYEEVITLVGMAMSGNVERLGRWVPELRNLENVLGKNATAAEKAEYAMRILNEKFGGASQKDLETYAGKVANLKNQWDELKESAGKALLPMATGLLSTIKWHVDFWTGEGPFKSVEKMIAEEKAALEAWSKSEKVRKSIQGTVSREESYKEMIRIAEESYKIEQEYAKKRAQLRGNEYELLDMERDAELEKVRKTKGDEYYVWEFYDEKKIELDKKTANQLQAIWLEYYEKQKTIQDQAVSVAQEYGVETTAGLSLEFKKLEKDWEEALKGPFTEAELNEIQRAILARAEELRTQYGGEGEDRNRLNQVEEAFKRTAESISDMRREADIIAGTGYRVQFDDAAVVQTVDELEAVTQWLKYICEERKWEVKLKLIPEGFEQVNEALSQTQDGGNTQGITSSPQQIDSVLADMVTKNRSKLSGALRRSKR